MGTTFGVTDQGFILKRQYDILADLTAALSTVQDPATGQQLVPQLADENDPLVQLVNALSDQLAVCWEQLQQCYNNFDPLKASGTSLAALVQLNGLLKQLGESDINLRQRQQLSTSFTAGRHVDAIFAAVLNVPGVTFCRIYQNSTVADVSGGLPAKTVSAVVVGGADADIAQALFSRVPLGVGYYGSTAVQVSDSQGFPYTIAFQRPTPVPITVEVDVYVMDSVLFPGSGTDQIKANIVDYAKYGSNPAVGFPPGVDVLRSRLYTPVNLIPGINISAIKLSRTTDAPSAQDITIAWNEVAVISSDNISVTIL